MRQTTVFCSSTCYDLRQLRNDLSEFITEMGHTPRFSDDPKFPIDDPSKGKVEICEQVVRDSDILVLVVGGRYGTVVGGTSITNREYNCARSVGVSVYVFIQAEVLTAYDSWLSDNSFKGRPHVEDPRVFEFIRQIDDDCVWRIGFSNAQDIISTLKTQWSVRFHSLLQEHRECSSIHETLVDPLDTKTLGAREGGRFGVLGGKECYILSEPNARIYYSRSLPPEGVLECEVFVPPDCTKQGLLICDANDQLTTEDFNVVLRPGGTFTFALKPDAPEPANLVRWLETVQSPAAVPGWHKVKVMWGSVGVKAFLDGQVYFQHLDETRPLHRVSTRYGIGKVSSGATRAAALGAGIRNLSVRPLRL